jgi:hypothetical protein
MLQVVIIKNKGKGIAAWVEGQDTETGKPCKINLPSVQVAVALIKHLSLKASDAGQFQGGMKYIYSL